jgi:hypothetical protein
LQFYYFVASARDEREVPVVDPRGFSGVQPTVYVKAYPCFHLMADIP